MKKEKLKPFIPIIEHASNELKPPLSTKIEGMPPLFSFFFLFFYKKNINFMY